MLCVLKGKTVGVFSFSFLFLWENAFDKHSSRMHFSSQFKSTVNHGRGVKATGIEVADYITPKRGRRVWWMCLCLAYFSFLYTPGSQLREWYHLQWVGLPTIIKMATHNNLIKIITIGTPGCYPNLNNPS